MQDEVEWLIALSDHVWVALVDVADGVQAADLRTSVIFAAQVTYAFMVSRTLTQVRQLPWALVVGDVEQNLQALQSDPEPIKFVSKRIWRLLRLHYNRDQLRQRLLLLQDCPWTTAVVEQLHASASTIRKFHPEYSQEVVLTRAMAHAIRRILPGMSKLEFRTLQENRTLNKL